MIDHEIEAAIEAALLRRLKQSVEYGWLGVVGDSEGVVVRFEVLPEDGTRLEIPLQELLQGLFNTDQVNGYEPMEAARDVLRKTLAELDEILG